MMPETDNLLAVGFEQSDTGVASFVSAGADGDYAKRDLGSNVIFGEIIVQYRVCMMEHSEQFGLVGIKPRSNTLSEWQPFFL